MPAAAPTPGLPLSQALDRSEPLGRLLAQVEESRRRLAVVAEALPAPLSAELRPGPLDEAGWTLLVARPAAAAKLRQLLPLLEQRLAEAGFAPRVLRVKLAVPQSMRMPPTNDSAEA